MKLNGLEKYFNTNVNNEIVNFKQIDNYGKNPLLFSILYNESRNLNLNKEQWDYLIRNSDLNQVDKYKSNALMYSFVHNKLQNINFTEKQFDFLIKNTDLKKIDENNHSSLCFALEYKYNNNINKKQWIYLINNSDINLIKENTQLLELKKIQSELLNDEILSKIYIKEDLYKKVKI